MAEKRTERQSPSVLIVDDDPVVRLLAGQALAAVGLTVEEAESGEVGLEAADRSRPDLVLLDVEMPGLSGFETCAELRQRSYGEEVLILIATGHTDAETIERAFQAGATDFIHKPLDWQLLQHRVRFLMRASQAFSDLRRTLSRLRRSQQRLANAQRLASIGNWEWTPTTGEMLWSEQVYRIFGIDPRPGAPTYKTFLDFVHPDDRPALEKAMRAAVDEAQPFELDHRIVVAPDALRIVHQQTEVARSASGAVGRVSGTIQDITDRRRAEEQIRYLAYYDVVTGLPNRRMLNEYLGRLLERARRRRDVLALLYVNLDRFKRINDTLGHALGDRLLRAVATRLTTQVRTTDYVGRVETERVATVSRVGGDEFAVVLSEIRSSEDAAQVARRVLETLSKPLALNGNDLVVSASVGIAVHPHDAADAETLLRNADAAMHHAKKAGGQLYQFFSESMNKRAMRNLELENALRAALGQNEFVLHYQPLQDVATGAIVGVEALARWPSPRLGLVSPGEFIPLAEETALIGPLGEWVLRTACAQNRAWQQAGLPPFRVAVNVSSHQVRKVEIVETVTQILRDTGLDPRYLELEITESALLGEDAGVVETLSRLKKLGVRLALDDFGTGYSSLSHLARFPIDMIKIDQSFVRKIGIDEQAQAIVAAVVAMGHRLRLGVTAEGVETAEQEQFLRAEGCDLLQGFRIGRPSAAEELAALLRSTNSG